MKEIISIDLGPNGLHFYCCVLQAAIRHSTLLALSCRLNIRLYGSQSILDGNFQ